MHKFCLLFLCLLIALPAVAQQTADAESLLKWFPMGTYMNLQHRDNVRLMSGAAYPMYQKYFETNLVEEEQPEKKGKKTSTASFRVQSTMLGGVQAGNILQDDNLNLPDLFKKSLLSATVAGVVELIEETDNNGGEIKADNVNVMHLEGAKGNTTRAVFISSRSNLAVYTFENLPALMQEAIDKSLIINTGKKIGRRPVYTFNSSRLQGKGSENFAWIDEMGEMLVASDMKSLRKMVRTGRGRGSRLLDDPTYVDLITIVPELGAKWSATFLDSSRRGFTSQMEVNPEIDTETLEQISEDMSRRPVLRVDSLSVEDMLRSRQYEVYEWAEAAAEAMVKEEISAEYASGSDVFGNIPQEMIEYRVMVSQRQVKELRDNIIITAIALDEELLLAEKKANEAMSKFLMVGRGVKLLTTDGKEIKIQMKAEEGKGGNEIKFEVESEKKKK